MPHYVNGSGFLRGLACSPPYDLNEQSKFSKTRRREGEEVGEQGRERCSGDELDLLNLLLAGRIQFSQNSPHLSKILPFSPSVLDRLRRSLSRIHAL